LTFRRQNTDSFPMHAAAQQNPTPRAQPAYFVNLPIDFALAGGLSILLFAALVLFRRPDRTGGIILVAAQLSWVVNWPHFSATNFRLYRSWENIRQYPLTALFIPWVILGAVVASLWSPHVLAPYFIKLFLIWSPYHFCAQTIGVTLIYLRRVGVQIRPWERRVLVAMIYSTLFTLLVRSEIKPETLQYYGIDYLNFGLPAWFLPVAGAATTLTSAGLVGCYLLWCRRAGRVLPPILLVPAAAQYLWFAGGWLWPSFIEFVPFFHSLQYLLIAWSLQLKEKRDRHEILPSRRFVVGESLRWYVINIAGGALLFFFVPQWVSKGTGLPLQFATGVFIAGVQIHHFFVDGVIWKLKRTTVSSPLMGNLSELLHPPTPAGPANSPS
jgi:hypothetical protein